MDGLTEADIAYVAGILDSMARVRIMRTQGGTELPLVAVACPNMPLLEYLGALTGVTPFVTRRSYDKHRCTEHCLEPHQHIVSESGRWSINGVRATVVLSAVLPYVHFQKSEIEEAVTVGLKAPKKQATPKKMSALGWPIPEEWQ